MLLMMCFMSFMVGQFLQMLKCFIIMMMLPGSQSSIECMSFHIQQFLNYLYQQDKEYNLIYLLLMQKKIGEISQAFEQLRFTECLTIIEQTLKKNSKQDKKQKQLTNVQIKVIQCFKVGSLISLSRQHQASIVYQQLISPEGVAIMGKQNPYLFIAISQLFGENKEKDVIQSLQKHSPAFDPSKVFRFYLNVRFFSMLSKLFMKQYATTKNNMSQLDQVYCEYLNQINKFNMIEYQRDRWHKYHPELKNGLKLVGMFVQRCLKTSEEAKVKIQNELSKEFVLQKDKLTIQLKKNIKVAQRSNELKLKIAINEGRVNDAIALYHSIRPTLKLPFTFIRSIVNLSQIFEQKELIHQFYIKEMQGIFKTNLNFSTYTPLYDYYNEFFNFLKQQAVIQSINLQESVKISSDFLPFEGLYNFEGVSIAPTLQNYYNSLISEYRYLTNTQNPKYAQNKKSDYYKICLKGLLLQILQISLFLGHEQTKLKYLKEYTTLFMNTLTYCQQLKKYWQVLIKHDILVNPTQVVNDSQLMSQINFTKVQIAVTTTSISNRDHLNQHYNALMGLYRLRVKEIEKNRKLQKGERYISDQFIIILVDYIRAYLQNEQQRLVAEQIISKIVNDLEYCVEVSSYNADLKLRLMYFLSLINHYERLIETYITNDIKSVQMETLGYWFLKVALEFGNESKNDQFFERLVKSYNENQRETSEYGLKALRAGELDRVQEYLVYRSNISNSYNSVVILFMLFHKYRFDANSQYYLLRINERINSFKSKQNELTFNADFRVMSNILFEDYHFGEFYGLYNSYQLLQQEVNVYLHQQYLINQFLERGNDVSIDSIEQLDKLQLRIKAFESASLYDFSAFTFQQDRLNYKLQSSKKSIERNGKLLDIFKLAMVIRISNIRLSNLLINSIKSQAINQEEATNIEGTILANLNKLKEHHKDVDYRSQIRSLVLIRRTLFQSHNLLSIIRQATSKNKKLKGIKAAIENATGKVLEQYYHAILTFKWSESPIKSVGLVSKRDEDLEEKLLIDVKQVKRIISKYQGLYKV